MSAIDERIARIETYLPDLAEQQLSSVAQDMEWLVVKVKSEQRTRLAITAIATEEANRCTTLLERLETILGSAAYTGVEALLAQMQESIDTYNKKND